MVYESVRRLGDLRQSDVELVAGAEAQGADGYCTFEISIPGREKRQRSSKRPDEGHLAGQEDLSPCLCECVER